MSSDSENDRVSYLARYPIDQEEVSRTGRRIIWANEFSYTYESVSVIRHEERPEEEFRQVRPRQLESEEQVHGLVRAWNERRRFETEEPFYEDVIDFLKSIQGAVFFANGQNPDVDEWSDDEEQEDEE